MASDQDEFGVSISGALDVATQSGKLSVSTKSRFIAAIDRMFGSVFDLPAAWIDSQAERLRHEAELKRNFRVQQAEAARKRFECQEGYALEIEKSRLASEALEFDRSLNCAAVAAHAIPLLENGVGEDATSDKNESVDNDWINRFRHYAREASSEELRHMWGRILAGECSKPGSFGASALRFIFELDRTLAEKCEEISQLVLGNAIFVGDELQSGSPLMTALSLQTAGLITGVGGDLSRNPTLNADGKTIFFFGDFGLEINGEPSHKVNLTVWLVTDLGSQIFSLLTNPKIEQNLRNLSILINKNKIKKIDLLKLGSETSHGRIILDRESLFDTEDSNPI